MKYVLYILSFLCIHFGYAQNTIIETGRPKPFVERNAQEIAGRKFKVNYEYIAFNNDPAQLDSISKINKATYAHLEKKYGAQWRGKIEEEIDAELHSLNAYLSVLESEGVINDENLVYFMKPKCGKKYTVNIYPNIEPENRSRENLIKQVRVKETGDMTEVKIYY